jgi:hypothetical protein
VPGGDRISVGPLAFSPDGRWLAMGNGTQGVLIWDRTLRRKAAMLEADPRYNASSLTFSPDSRILVAGSTTLRFWDVATWQALTPALPHPGGFVTDLAFTVNGQLLAVKTMRAGTVLHELGPVSSWPRRVRRIVHAAAQCLRTPVSARRGTSYPQRAVVARHHRSAACKDSERE